MKPKIKLEDLREFIEYHMHKQDVPLILDSLIATAGLKRVKQHIDKKEGK